jgi:hypothetical protein
MFTSEPTPSPHHMLCSACLNLSGLHYSSLNKWKQSKMAEPTPSPHHMLCSACLNLSGLHYSSLNKWKQSKMAEDPTNVVLQSGKEQLESKSRVRQVLKRG